MAGTIPLDKGSGRRMMLASHEWGNGCSAHTLRKGSDLAVNYRRARADDTRACFQVFYEALDDLCHRLGVNGFTGVSDPSDLDSVWEPRRPLFEHLSGSTERSWLAEDDGDIIGYARAIERDGVLQLTEFFVRPGRQDAGIGHELLERAFPHGDFRRRLLLATVDSRGLARYMKAGVFGRFPVLHFSRTARAVEISSELSAEVLQPTAALLAELAGIDRAVIAYERAVDHRWLMAQRSGFLFRRGTRVLGYGYIGARHSGPVALLDPGAWAAVLGYLEAHAAAEQWTIGFDTPMPNEGAIRFFLDNGYVADTWLTVYMADEPSGRFDRYLISGPTFFL